MSDRELLEMALEAMDVLLIDEKWYATKKALRARLAQPDLARVGEVGVWGEPVVCECHRCIKEKDLRSNGGLPLSMGKMILCPKCGNKRCPKASDHRLDCTGSNEPGQPGSVYTHPPVAASDTSQQRVDETQEQRHEPVIDRSAAKRICSQLGWEPKREWKGLTDEERRELFFEFPANLIDAIEAKLKEKNYE